MNKISKKGFTLIEVLVVASIIGILASIVLIGLGGARARGRDARRIADLREVQNSLELYFTATNKYPTVNDWQSLTTALVDPNNGLDIKQIPNDPSGGTYLYGSDGAGYVVGAKLESNNSVLQTSFHGNAYNVDCSNAQTYCIQF